MPPKCRYCNEDAVIDSKLCGYHRAVEEKTELERLLHECKHEGANAHYEVARLHQEIDGLRIENTLNTETIKLLEKTVERYKGRLWCKHMENCEAIEILWKAERGASPGASHYPIRDILACPVCGTPKPKE